MLDSFGCLKLSFCRWDLIVIQLFTFLFMHSEVYDKQSGGKNVNHHKKTKKIIIKKQIKKDELN